MSNGRVNSPERNEFNSWLSRFRDIMKDGALVYDIGKSHLHDYKTIIEAERGLRYRSIDRDPDKKPDIIADVELDGSIDQADAAICNGVIEQSDDPVGVIKGAARLVKMGGYVLFVIISVGYPLFERDFCRFTPNGVIRVLNNSGFEIKDFHIITRDALPSYVFSICKKVS